ncbi:hypothetical protein DIW83_04230 [Acinetobacter nosocomialis]|nr:hypothetical protein DIW83_04230 [Acinetobacter nosocomialis]
MGNFFLLQALTVVFALSIATTIFNKRILGFPQAIGVPLVSAIFVVIGVSTLCLLQKTKLNSRLFLLKQELIL